MVSLTDCKSVAYGCDGSIPSPPTILERRPMKKQKETKEIGFYEKIRPKKRRVVLRSVKTMLKFCDYLDKQGGDK